MCVLSSLLPRTTRDSPPVTYVRHFFTAITVKVKANMSFKKIFEAAEVSVLRRSRGPHSWGAFQKRFSKEPGALIFFMFYSTLN